MSTAPVYNLCVDIVPLQKFSSLSSSSDDSSSSGSPVLFFIIYQKSSVDTTPSPSLSASSIISLSSSSLMSSPNSWQIFFKFLSVIYPVWSSSNKRNILSISSLVSALQTLPVIISRNSSKFSSSPISLSSSKRIFLSSSF